MQKFEQKTLVLVFGTFDIFHPGHEYFLKQAKKHGSLLYVVVARDQTVKRVKGALPHNDENKRLETLQSLDYVDTAMLGSLDDKYKMIEQINPDVICLGYDQNSFTKDLEDELKKRNLHPKLIQFKDSFMPDRFKSSKLRLQKQAKTDA
jgi:FAD synthetase